MNSYMLELVSLGYTPHDACRLYYSFLKEFSIKDLEEFIRSKKQCG